MYFGAVEQTKYPSSSSSSKSIKNINTRSHRQFGLFLMKFKDIAPLSKNSLKTNYGLTDNSNHNCTKSVIYVLLGVTERSCKNIVEKRRSSFYLKKLLFIKFLYQFCSMLKKH